MNKRGFTLLEVMISVAILTIVMGTMLTLGVGVTDTAEAQELKVRTNEQARQALQILVPRVRQAARGTINWNALPGPVLSFRMATDVSGNGTAVDVGGNLELSGVITVRQDRDDINGDGVTASQLVMTDGVNPPRVLGNNLLTGAAAATNATGPPDGVGFWVEPRGNGLEITVRSQGRSRRGLVFTTEFTEFVAPRN